uniref:EOG090X0CJA n=1 Tax=Scapholeberis mucronata TaxID=202097 RepID=A0A4Y7NMP3_9CRUS|nr:EOG090X0CJA [Scapholeberis mucronata]SVE93854.1 EOG090X0CJA [Scapholeberis mucronata]
MSENENTNGGETPQAPSANGFNALKAHIARNKIDFGLWCTRLATIVFTFNYIIPIFGSGYNMYYKALLANSATSALRLHQRLPQVQLSREFLGKLFLEDSAHYLLYSMIFFYSPPVTWVLLPVFLFALLHIASYALTMIELLGSNALGLLRMGIGIVEVQSVNLLRTIAFSEIFLFPMLILSLFSGRATLMTLFVYYRFLTLRYSSRRNPYTRNTFGELRFLVESYAQNPSCPAAIRNLVSKMVAFISRLAPPIITTEQ